MNFFVADPHWGLLIILYFYLGGIAAGAYFFATLIDLIGTEEDRQLPRIGYWLAFPLISVCGLLLVADLDRPLRFWHMLFKSEVVGEAIGLGWPTSSAGWSVITHAPLLKYWSPMSIGSWGLTAFGLCTFLSFLGSLWPEGRLEHWLRHGVVGRTLQVIGSIAGLFIAGYTGSLLAATNQPLWSDTVWLAPLFLASAASTSLALMILIARWRNLGSPAARRRLELADLWSLGLELIVFGVFLASLGGNLIPVLETWHGKLLVFGTLLIGLVIPLGVHLTVAETKYWGVTVMAVSALVGGLLLRYAVVETPPEILHRYAEHGFTGVATFSPEDARPRGGGLGADPNNRGGGDVQPYTKIPGMP